MVAFWVLLSETYSMSTSAGAYLTDIKKRVMAM